MFDLIIAVRGYIISGFAMVLGSIFILKSHECKIFGFKFEGFEHHAKQRLIKKRLMINDENIKEEEEYLKKTFKVIGIVLVVMGLVDIILELTCSFPIVS